MNRNPSTPSPSQSFSLDITSHGSLLGQTLISCPDILCALKVYLDRPSIFFLHCTAKEFKGCYSPPLVINKAILRGWKSDRLSSLQEKHVLSLKKEAAFVSSPHFESLKGKVTRRLAVFCALGGNLEGALYCIREWKEANRDAFSLITSILQHACVSGNINILEELYQTNREGSCIYAASAANRIEVLEWLVQRTEIPWTATSVLQGDASVEVLEWFREKNLCETKEELVSCFFANIPILQYLCVPEDASLARKALDNCLLEGKIKTAEWLLSFVHMEKRDYQEILQSCLNEIVKIYMTEGLRGNDLPGCVNTIIWFNQKNYAFTAQMFQTIVTLFDLREEDVQEIVEYLSIADVYTFETKEEVVRLQALFSSLNYAIGYDPTTLDGRRKTQSSR